MSAEELRLRKRVEELEKELEIRRSEEGRSRSRSASRNSVGRSKGENRDNAGGHILRHSPSLLFEDTKSAVREQELDKPKYFQSERMGFSVCKETGGITATVLDRIGRVLSVGARPPKILYKKEDFEAMVVQMVGAYRWQSIRFSQPSVLENMKPVILPFLESVLHESNREWLEELYSGKKRRYNPNGFHLIKIMEVATGDANKDFSLRLHLYEASAGEDIHVHNGHLESMVLSGGFRHVLYDSPGIGEESWERTYSTWQRKKIALRKSFQQLIGGSASTPSQKDENDKESYWFTPDLQNESLDISPICREKEHDCTNFPRYLAGVVYGTVRKSFRDQQFERLADDAIDLVKFADREEKPGNYYFLDARIPHQVAPTDTPPCTFLVKHPVGQHRPDGWVFRRAYDPINGTRNDFDAKSKEEKQTVFDNMKRALDETHSKTLLVADQMTFDDFRGRLERLLEDVRKNFPRGTGSQQQVR